MSRNYRYDPYDRIMARLREQVEAERYVITCPTCLSKYDSRHWASCPYCKSAAHRRGEL